MSETLYGIIYIAKNQITGKVYIGQTIKRFSTRISERYSDAKRGKDTKFCRALLKYEKINWNWEILENNISADLLDTCESEYISKFNSMNGGYNSDSGGNYNRVISEGTRKKISIAISGINHPMYGKHHTKEAKKKISETRIKEQIAFGENNPMYGKRHTNETKRKMSENHADFSGKNNPMFGKRIPEDKIRCYTYEIIFPNGNSKIVKNLAKFCRENSLNNSHMNAVSLGKRKHHKQYRCIRK